MNLTKLLLTAVAAAGVSACATTPDYPTKPVKLIVPYTQGSATDVIARAVGAKLSEIWKQPVMVENIAGAGGSTGAGVAAKATPDGYTLLVHSSSYAVNQALYAKLPYAMQDFIDVAPLARQPFALVANPGAGYKGVADLIAAAKAAPGQLKFGSAGAGSATHFAAEKFRRAASIDVVHVPFKGGPEANDATASGEVSYWFPPIAIALKGVKEGQLQALAVTSAARAALLPDTPTLAEAGLSGFEDSAWWGVWLPAGVPAQVPGQLAQDIARVLAAPDLREKLAQSGYEPMRLSAAEFTRLVQRELSAAATTIKEAGIETK